MSITPEKLTELSPQAKRDLLAQLLREKEKQRAPKNAPVKDELPQIVADPEHRFEPFPLTDIQQAYWLGRSAAFDLGRIGIHGYFELDCTDLDIERLNAAWMRVIERHDMMRAVILPEGVQRIQKTVPPYKFEVLDLRAAPPVEAAAQLDALRQRMSHQVYDPESWPLFEIRASRLNERVTRLHFSEDALHADMMSTAIILDDWLRLYENPELVLPAPELSFRDYALALERVKDSDAYSRSMAYWRKRVEQLPGAPELPFTKTFGSLSQTRFTRRSMTLDAETWSRLKDLAAKNGITSSSLLLAIYSEVLGAWSANTRFCINVTVYNRLPLHPQVEQIAGDFTSMIFLEVDRATASTFTERARRLQKQLWNDLAYRHVSGVEILRELARHQGRAPEAMMPVVFTGTLGTPGYRSLTRLGEMVYSVTQTPQVILDQQVFEEDACMVLSWDTVEELFPVGVLDQMFEASSSLLSRLANDERCWHESAQSLIPVAPPEQPTISTAIERPIPEATLHALFSEQAARRPQQSAIVTPGRTLSYADLERQSNYIARRLQLYGVRPNTLVAVVMEKGWEQVAAVLGILKAGAAYLPLDPQLPRSRRFELLADAEVEVALTQAWLGEAIEWPDGVRVETVRWREEEEESQPEESEQAREEASESRAGAEQGARRDWEELAYVIYTSGSTGFPKGVMIEHRSVVNRMIDVVERFGITSGDKALALTALHHDLSVFDIFGMLAVAGGTIVIPDADSLLDPSHWLELIERERVTIWNSVPAFMQMMIESLEAAPLSDAGSFASLRLALLSGDWIPVDLPERLRAVNRMAQLVSLGGPTETTVWDICYPIAAIDPGWKSIPYGQPMVNTRYYVLKDNLESCPVWVTGELCIAGAGLARGYWRGPLKTESSFITHPQTGERLYRSGDTGRYLPDGNIEILGRKDFQVKIRGQRIELGEIESVLRQHPQVVAALATVFETREGIKQLVAYVVPRGESVAQSRDLQNQPASHSVEALADSSNGGNGHNLDALAKLEFQLKQHGLRDEQSSTRVALVKPELTETFLESHARRRSQRKFLTDTIRSAQFGGFLSCLMQIKQEGSVFPKYRYPSTANLYPVQIYLYVKPNRIEGINEGVYYYHPIEHTLALLSPGALVERSVHAPQNQGIFDESAFSIFLVGQLSAIAPLYPEQARDFCLLEAGYIGQLLMSVAPEHSIGLCPIGGLDFDQIRPFFALDEGHTLLHSLCGGLSLPSQNGHAASSTEQSIATGRSQCQRATDERADARTLQDFLSEKLPDYMIPQHIVLLDSLPLTTNGKVDRKALPLPQSAVQAGALPYAPPKTDLEKMIAAVWQEVLGVEAIGSNSNFYELGATSIHMVQVRAKLNQLTGKPLSIVDMFRHPTVNSLAGFINSEHDDQKLLDESHSRAATRKTLQHRRRPVKE